MVATEITLLVIWFVLYVLFKGVHPFLAHIFVFITFVFAYTVSNQSFSAFYLILFLIAIVVDLSITEIDSVYRSSSSFTFQHKFTAQGFGFTILSLVAGLIMFFAISLLSRQAGGNIVGVPDLSITTSSQIGMSFKPVFQSALGIIENTFAFAVFDILLVFGVMLPVLGMLFRATTILLPMLVTGFAMGLLHITAYSVAVGLIIYASIAFMMFIVVRILLKDSLASDTAHYTNNAVVSVGQGLSIV